MKALVTGSNGFIGSTLVEHLLSKKYKVICFVRKTSNLRWLQNLDVTYAYGELSDPESLINPVTGADIIFHLAGVTKAKDWDGYVHGNYQSTVNLIETIKKHGSPQAKLVFISSQAAGGPSIDGRPRTEDMPPQPVSFYGKSKLMAEEAVLDFCKDHPAVIIRPPSVYGPKDRDVFLLFKNIQKGFMPLLGKGDQRVSVIYISDLIDGIFLAGTLTRANGQLYYMSGDGEFDWQTIGRTIARALHKRPIKIRMPLWTLNVLSFFATVRIMLTGKHAILNPDKVREMKQPGWLCSNEKAKEELGFRPQIDLEQGITMTAEWYKEMGWLKSDGNASAGPQKR